MKWRDNYRNTFGQSGQQLNCFRDSPDKEYGFKKFMIVVLSIDICKGVEKSMEQLQDHFKRLYNIDLSKHSFIYDSNNPKHVSSKLVESNDLSICVMDIQAFNKDTNKIRTEDEYGQILWEDIKYIKPTIIIDEPQKIEGTKRNKSKSLRAIGELQSLFTLRYSATHKQNSCIIRFISWILMVHIRKI